MAKILKRIEEYLNKHISISLLAGSLALGSLLDLGMNTSTYFMDRKPFAELQNLSGKIETVKSDLNEGYIKKTKEDLDSFYESFYVPLNQGSMRFRRDIEKLAEPLDKFLSESRSIKTDKDYRTSLYDPRFRQELEIALNETQINCRNYNGSLDGKFHYHPFGLAICSLSGLLGASLFYFHNKCLDKKYKKMTDDTKKKSSDI